MTRTCLILFGTMLLVACSGGGGDGGGSGPATLFVGIDTPAATTVTAGSVDLYGLASCDGCPPSTTAFGYCPAIDPPGSSNVDVTWTNRATGTVGATSHAIVGQCSCLFSQCFVTYSHRWSAQVQLAFGPNAIEVRASDPTGGSGLDSVTITRLPAAVGDLAASPGKGEATLSWGPVAGATSYDLYYATSRDVTPATGTKIAGVASPYAHAGLTDEVTYYYTLATVVGTIEGPASAVVWATPGWRTEDIAATAPTTLYFERDVSIATDSTGHAHVHHSFGDVGPGGVLQNDYLTNAGGSWSTLPVAHPGWISAGIALDAADMVHVAYFGAGLRHAVLAAGSWSAESADPAGWCSSSLALDAAGRAHLAYYQSAAGDTLRYATNASGAWLAADVATAGTGGCSAAVLVSLAVDGTGAAHVAFSGDYPAYGLRYATNRGGSWVASTLDSGYVTSLSLAVDPHDKVHIAYSSGGELRYAEDVTGSWAMAVLASAGSPGHAALALDATGKAHLSYLDGRYGGELHYLTNAAGAWRDVPIDAAAYDNGGNVTDTAIAVDFQGKVHIGYYRDGNLRYATNR